MASTSPVLLVDRGDLPSLTALAIQPDPSRLILWHFRERDVAAVRRAEVAERHANMLGTELVVADVPLEWVGGEEHDAGLTDPSRGGMAAAVLLLRAVAAARRWGCSKVIWPVQVGPDAEEVSRTAECATAVGEIADLTTGTDGSVVIDLPLIDLDDDQVVDLADDAGAAIEAFWPCCDDGETPCPSPPGCPGCARWRRAFEGRGFPWPWQTWQPAASC